MAELLLIPIKTKLKTCKYFLRTVTEKQLMFLLSVYSYTSKDMVKGKVVPVHTMKAY